MNGFSIFVGICSLIVALIGLIPFFGWLNWFALLGAIVGGLIGLFDKKKSGLWLNLIVLILATFRLTLGGGIL